MPEPGVPGNLNAITSTSTIRSQDVSRHIGDQAMDHIWLICLVQACYSTCFSGCGRRSTTPRLNPLLSHNGSDTVQKAIPIRPLSTKAFTSGQVWKVRKFAIWAPSPYLGVCSPRAENYRGVSLERQERQRALDSKLSSTHHLRRQSRG